MQVHDKTLRRIVDVLVLKLPSKLKLLRAVRTEDLVSESCHTTFHIQVRTCTVFHVCFSGSKCFVEGHFMNMMTPQWNSMMK